MSITTVESAPASPLLDAPEVSDLLKVPVKSVYPLADAKILPGEVRVGRLRRWRRDAIEAWIAAGGSAWPGGWRKTPATRRRRPAAAAASGS